MLPARGTIAAMALLCSTTAIGNDAGFEAGGICARFDPIDQPV